jgi:tetratricopeptide (TPR) repeat protein
VAGAIKDLEAAAGLKPNLYHAQVNLAEAYSRNKDPAKAVAHTDRAIALQPAEASLYSTRARFHFQQHKDSPAGLADLDEAIRRAPAGGLPSALARDHRERAQVLYFQRRYPQADLACQAAIDLNPDDPAAHQLHGGLLYTLGCLADALEAFDDALAAYARSADPRIRPDAAFFRLRAHVCRDLRDPPGVLAECTRPWP